MKKAGRPSKFSQSLALRILELAKDGKTDEEIACVMGIAVSTLNNWKGNKKGFMEALKASKNVADALVEGALFQRAIGYSHPAVKIFCSEGSIQSAPYTEVYPPDTTACIFWLKNRQKKRWRDCKEVVTKEQAIKVLEDELKREGTVDSGQSQEEPGIADAADKPCTPF